MTYQELRTMNGCPLIKHPEVLEDILSTIRRRNQELDEAYSRWYGQALELKKIYPEFDLAEASKDDKFVSQLAIGSDVKTAYETAERMKKGMAPQAAPLR